MESTRHPRQHDAAISAQCLVMREFAQQDHPTKAIDDLRHHIAALNLNADEAKNLTRMVARVATMQEANQDEYIGMLASALPETTEMRALVRRHTAAMRTPTRERLEASLRLTHDVEQMLEDAPSGHQLTGRIRADLREARMKAARVIAGSMLYQGILAGSEKQRYVRQMAETIPERNETIRTVGKITVATMHMDNWPARAMEPLTIIQTVDELGKSLQARSVLHRPANSEPTEGDVRLNITERIVLTHGKRLMEDPWGADRETERDLMKFWLEVRANMPGDEP